MKVRISIPGTYMAMEMEEEQARRTFRKLAESLWLIGSKNQKQPEDSFAGKEERLDCAEPIHAIEPELVTVSVEEVSIEQETSTAEAVVEVQEKAGEESEPKIISSGYGGFLYMKCPVCGKVKGFCAKTRLINYRCECGAVSKMRNMVPLFLKCECGRRAKYLTNMTGHQFDIVCYDCGAPVAVEWNGKKGIYETIK